MDSRQELILETIINDNQVHFDPPKDNDALYETLTSNDWEVQQQQLVKY